ncbi:hypothetical protein [Mycolicibacterium sp. XJ2546]
MRTEEMLALQCHRSRVISAAALIGALAAVPAVVVVAGQTNPTLLPRAQSCTNEMTGSIRIADCIPSVNPPERHIDERGPNQLPTLYGIPCGGSECLGLSRALQGAAAPTPDTEVRSNP